jgi:hypothetical protein
MGGQSPPPRDGIRIPWRRSRSSSSGVGAEYITRLKSGETVQFRPRGHSMKGEIDSGQLCTVEPVDPNSLEVGDIVLCKVNGNQYLHLSAKR